MSNSSFSSFETQFSLHFNCFSLPLHLSTLKEKIQKGCQVMFFSWMERIKKKSKSWLRCSYAMIRLKPLPQEWTSLNNSLSFVDSVVIVAFVFVLGSEIIGVAPKFCLQASALPATLQLNKNDWNYIQISCNNFFMRKMNTFLSKIEAFLASAVVKISRINTERNFLEIQKCCQLIIRLP